MKNKVTISTAALLARINRKLAHSGEKIKKARSERARQDVGDYFIVKDGRLLVYPDVDPEDYGRKIGVLQKYETVGE